MIDAVTGPETKIGGDLVIAGSGGVKTTGCIADHLSQPGFDVHMNVFELGFGLKRALFQFLFDLGQAIEDGGHVFRAQNVLFAEHFGMRFGTLNVLTPQADINADAGIDLFHDIIGLGFKPAAPHFVGFCHNINFSILNLILHSGAEGEMEALIVESLAKYYGLDWLALAAGVLGMYLLTQKSRWGFLLSGVSAISGFAVALISLQFGYVVYNVLLIVLMIKGFHEWGRQPQPVAAE